MKKKTEQTPESVSSLTTQIRQSLQRQFSDVLVEGELTDVIHASSGHVYLSLKDESARISSVIWRSTASRLRFRLEDGLQVICRGAVEVYAPRGVYQLIVRSIQPAGQGALELAFRQLFERLKAEGLFDRDRKRPIPEWPRRIAVVTSPQGAAIRDFVEVLYRRWPSSDLIVVPTRVQGPGSASEIAAAIKAANLIRPTIDVIVVCRGGGSLEDLWAFNEEIVCRAVVQSAVPVVSGVGHEVDVTLCDLSADLRALTPSEAAERIVPDRQKLLAEVRGLQNRMFRGLHRNFQNAQAIVHQIASRAVLKRPLDRIEYLRQRLDDMLHRLESPSRRQMDRARHTVQELGGKLESLGPMSVFRRGYSITTDERGKLVKSIADIEPQSEIRTRVADGTIVSRVNTKSSEQTGTDA